MIRLIDDIAAFLKGNGFEFSCQKRDDFDVLYVKTRDGKYTRTIMPIEINADSPEEARSVNKSNQECIRFISRTEGYPLIITEDRWKRQRQMMEARLLAHLELFSQAYARNCEVKRIENTEAQEFMKNHHSYGHAACRYRYGLFLKRHTGHIAEEVKAIGSTPDGSENQIGRLIAVATFSNARRWLKDGKEIRSYEWTRYASLPDMRVSGGMGKLLKAFINEVHPDDIMSYADLEWSEGSVYERLGFKKEDTGKEPVMFAVDSETWERKPMKPGINGNRFFMNFGSSKYRLKLTEYR